MKKKKIYVIGLLTFILGIGMIAIGFVFYKHNQHNIDLENKVDDKEQKNKDNEESNDTIPVELLNYYEDILEMTNYFDNYLLGKYDFISPDTLPSDEKTLFLLNIICNATNPQVSIQNLTTEMNKFFPPFDLYLGDIHGTGGNILYKYEDGVYNYNLSEANQYKIFTKEVANQASYDNWIITKKIYYIKGKSDGKTVRLNVYSNQESEKPIYSYDSKSSISVNSLSDEEYAKIESQLDTITYTYKRNNDKYILESIIKN